ncbi:MAG TPA: hypothetical protein VFL41_12645 [Gaiellaceae bacterium]|nr:hypothetical protein [Gaiellaceae bacterium]
MTAAVAACGGGDSDEESAPAVAGRTFRGGGLSFVYPANWRKRPPRELTDDVTTFQVTVGPRGRANDKIAVSIGTTGIVIEGKPLAITEENLEENKDLALTGVEFMVSIGGGKLGEPTRVTVAGLPGFRVKASGVKVWKDGRVDVDYTDVFKGSTSYTVSCVYTPAGAAEVRNACEQVLRSLRVS